MKKKVFVANLAMALCATCVVRGDGPVTANWLPTAAGTYSITNTAYWDTGFAPTNFEYVANFAPAAIDGAQNIDFPNSQSSWRLGTVCGASNQTIRTPARHTNGMTYRHLEVANPNGFQGTWAFQDTHSRFYLTPTNDLVPTVASFDCYYAPLLLTARGTSVIERLTGGGLLHRGSRVNEVESDNVLRIKGVDPLLQSRTRIRMANHSVVSLDYEGPPTNLPVTAGVYVRFDASRADTIDTVEENGRRYVTAWRDADGRGVTAVQNLSSSHTQRPWLSEVTSVNGVPLVDFGAFEQTNSNTEDVDYDTLKETLGPSASLVFTETTQAREVFVVWQDTQATGTRAFVVGSTGQYHLHRGSAGYLLADYFGELHANDETYVDGILRSWKFGPYDFTQLTVASMNIAGGCTLGTLVQDRYIRYGGARLAEVIIYTRELTSLERRTVHAYLQRKWTWGGKAGPFMLRDIQVDSFDQPFEVPDGRTVGVGSLKVSPSQTFVKRGGGTLNVDTLANEGLKLRVEGGAVTFNRWLANLDDSAPADDPALWLDATVADSFVYTNLENGVEGRTYIHRWNDRRATQTSRYAIPFTAAFDTNRPFVVSHAYGELPAVDFGYGCITNSAVTNWTGSAFGAARLQFNASVSAFDGFVVLRMNNPDSYYECLERSGTSRGRPALFGVYHQGFTRWGSSNLLAGYAGQGELSAFWTVNGVSYVPYYDSFDFGTSDFHVVSFSQHGTAIRVDRLADDRNIVYGGQQIAEMLLYTRPLSERERLQTEAYLMKRWKGVASPAMRETVKLDTVTFADGVDPLFRSDRPVTMTGISTSGGTTIRQQGSGSATLPTVSMVTESPHGYVADGGTLTIDLSDLFGDAFYHFDATDAESLVDDGAGGITQWLDTRRNGMAAESLIADVSVAKPTLKTVATRNGKEMPVLDFGDASKSGNTTSADSAGLRIKRNGSGLGESDNVKELHVVYCDVGSNFDGYKQRFIFSDSNYYQFHRGESNGQMFGAYNDNKYGACVRSDNCYVAVDGVKVAWNYDLKDKQFHVISVAPTNGVPVRSIAHDRNCRAGGCYQGELIAFKDYLSPARRAYLQKYLAWKWFGEGTEPVYTNSATSLRVANGGTLAFTGASTISVPSVGGSGTINVGEVVDVSSLAFDFPDETSYDHLTVNGTLALAASGTVSVTVGAGVTTAGDSPLLTATALAGGLGGWTKAIDNQSKMSVSLVLRDNALYLRLLPRGTVIFFR